MSDHLTEAWKRKYLPMLLQEFGYICYQCEKSLDGKNYVFDHMDDNRKHNEYTNIALACQSCNIKKVNDYDMKIKAVELKKTKGRGFNKICRDT